MPGIYAVLEQLLLMAVLITLGYYLSRSGKLNKATEKGIAELTIDIAFPALVFTNIIQEFDLEMLKEYLTVPISSSIITAASIFFILALTSLLKYPEHKRKEFSFVTSFSNNIFVGAPICMAFFGTQGLILAIFYDFGMHIILWTLGIWLLNDKNSKANSNFLANLFSPPIIGLLSGIIVVLLGIEIPKIITNITSSIGSITVPLAMIFIGLQLAKSRFKTIAAKKEIYMLSSLRLLIFPLLVYSVMYFLPLSPVLKGVITLEAAMPVFASSPVIMRKYGHTSNLASEIIFATIIFMVFTLPLFVYLII
jgi:hypothetical protein